MDRQAFSTLSKLFNRDRLSVYKRYKWICEHQVGQGNALKYKPYLLYLENEDTAKTKAYL